MYAILDVSTMPSDVDKQPKKTTHFTLGYSMYLDRTSIATLYIIMYVYVLQKN